MAFSILKYLKYEAIKLSIAVELLLLHSQAY
jgi:hypothetical protein